MPSEVTAKINLFDALENSPKVSTINLFVTCYNTDNEGHDRRILALKLVCLIDAGNG